MSTPKKRPRLRTVLVVVPVALLLFVGAAAAILVPRVSTALDVANGYAAKWVCSNVFVAGRDFGDATDDLPPNPLTPWVRLRLFEPAGYDAAPGASAEALFAEPRRAVYREGIGCTLLPPGGAPNDLAALDRPDPAADLAVSTPAVDPWPEALDAAFDAALDRAFAEPASEDGEESEPMRKTRAVVVAHRGTIVAERYADGFDAGSVLPGWSMTKSWTHALVGRAVALDLVDLHAPLDPSPWADAPADDPRRALDLDVLLRMASGLDFEEDYGDLESSALRMLFLEPDMGAFAASQPLAHPPGTRWYYSSGTTNLVVRHLRKVVEARGESWGSFPRRVLFAPLGMTSGRVEPDVSGTFVGSSYGWATARDWARFGQLYLQDGTWQGERLLPEGWADHAAAPTAGSGGVYGAHWWLNAPTDPDDPGSRRWPELPADLYFASGFDGQAVVVLPSHDAVIVRLGLTQDRSAWSLEELIADVIAALQLRLQLQKASSTTIGE